LKRKAFLLSPSFLLLRLASWAEPHRGFAPVPSDFTDEVEKFADLSLPKHGGILLVGSSIFSQWTNVVCDLAPLPVTNRAFGGSQTSQQLMFFDQVVSPCRPALIVWYCGSNDIKEKNDPSTVLQWTEEWLGKVAQTDPATRVLLVSVIRASQKRHEGQLEAVDAVNQGYEKLSQTRPGISYVDVNPALQTSTGEARAELYIEDGLHLSVEGYRQLTTVLKPAIQRYWKKKEPNP